MFSYSLCRLKPVHYGHVAVHKYQLVVLPPSETVAGVPLVLLSPPHDHLDSLLAVERPIRLHLKAALDDGLQGQDVEDVVIDY